MGILKAIGAWLLGCVIVMTAWAAAVQMALPPSAMQVEDGDTLQVIIDGRQQRLQLAGIDAPEDSDNPKLQRDLQRTGLDRQRLLELGRKSTDHLRGLVADSSTLSLDYQPGKLDRYGRLSGDLLDERGHSLAKTMLVDGYAAASRDAPGPMQLLQDAARRAGKGLWGADLEASDLWAGLVEGRP